MAAELPAVLTVSAHDLAKELHAQKGSVFLLDCRPVLSFSSCHISGAANINLASMMKKRFMAGKIGLVDLISSAEAKEQLKNGHNVKVVVYDECTTEPKSLSANNTAYLVIIALCKLGKTPRLLKGGISEFGVLHPSLCEVSVSPLRRAISTGPRATTPGQRDQALDWKTAPPVFILSYLVLGSEKDAHSKEVLQEFGVRYILNVTANCPNYFEEDDGFVYKRISVSDTGTQKLSQHFSEAFEFIEEARKQKSCILIHCMAGISRSVTLTIAYLMKYFGMPMQSAYQYVKERRPAISPNLNFMGQLVEFENCSEDKECVALKLTDYMPSLEQDELSEGVKGRASSSAGSSTEHTPEASRGTPEASRGTPESGRVGNFVLKLPASNKRKNKKKVSPRTSPRILTEDAVDLTPTNGGVKEEHSAVNSIATVKGSGGVLPAVLLRKGSVEQAIKSFEKLRSDS